MIIWLGLRWWYSAGWQWAWQRMVVDRVTWIMETFSTSDLLRTLFAPYRQTFAGQTKGSINAFFRGLVDNLISRVIGMIVRLLLILFASVLALVTFIFGTVFVMIWPLIPALPVISLVFVTGGVGV